MTLRFVSAALMLLALQAHADEPRLQCDIGPVTKVFGAVKWLVYSCSDAETLVVLSAPDSPASGFYFVLSPEGKGYKVQGEGESEGSRSVTDAARKDLEALSARDILALLRETRMAKGH